MKLMELFSRLRTLMCVEHSFYEPISDDLMEIVGEGMGHAVDGRRDQEAMERWVDKASRLNKEGVTIMFAEPPEENGRGMVYGISAGMLPWMGNKSAREDEPIGLTKLDVGPRFSGEYFIDEHGGVALVL